MRTQKGRSMLEMLGVLAVIAVLSVMALFGYRYALDKNKANTLLEEARLMALMASSDGVLEKMQTDDEYAKTDILDSELTPYEMFLTRRSTLDYEIEVANVSKGVCQKLADRDVLWAQFVIANDGACLKSDNVIHFYFNRTFDKTHSGCFSAADCAGCQVCVNSVCVDEDSSCEGENPYCVTGDCVKCPNGQFNTQSGCVDCSDKTVAVTTASDCHKCPYRLFRAENESSGSCYSCSDTGRSTQIEWTLEECRRCPDRFFNPETKLCRLCEKGQKPSADGLSCVAELDCPPGSFSAGGFNWTDEVQCMPCSDTAAVYAGKEECHRCSNQFFYESYQDSVCFGCDTTWADGSSTRRTIEKSECDRCPNRYYVAETKQCLFCPEPFQLNADKTACAWACPSDYFGAMEGMCLKCAEPSSLYATKEECEKCDNRFFVSPNRCHYCRTKRNADGSCTEPCAEGYYYYNQTSCDKCTNASGQYAEVSDCHLCENRFVGYDESHRSICYACDDKDFSLVRTSTLEECRRCPQRYFNSETSKCLLCSAGQTASSDGLSCVTAS